MRAEPSLAAPVQGGKVKVRGVPYIGLRDVEGVGFRVIGFGKD